MRLYTVAFITWAASIATSESNVANLNSDKVADYTELSDLSAKQIVQPYLTGVEARNFRQTNSEDHPNDAANVKLNKSTFYADERRSNVISTTEFSPSKVIYATPFIETAEKYPFTEHLIQEPEYAVSEDVLLVENVGSFGQKVRQGQDHSSDRTSVGTRNFRITNDQRNDKYTDFQTSSSTASSLGNEDNRETYVSSTTRVSFVSAQKKKNSLSNNSPADESKAIDSEVTSRKSGRTDIASSVENNVVVENLPTSQVRLSRTDNNTTSDETTKKFSAEREKTQSATSVEISPSLQLGKFSGPIVVPDLPDKEPEEEATVDYVNDDAPDMLRDAEIIFETDEGSKIASNSITSSFMLNPLQVGITLVNANVAGLTGDSEQSAATDTKDYVQGFSRLTSAGNNGSQSRVNYNNENSRHFEEGKQTAENKLSDNSVEIQKSIELYHVAPIHEIHYPVEYIQHTSNGVIETDNIGSSQRPKYNEDEQLNSQPHYDTYRDNNHEKNVIKAHASTLLQKFNRQHEYVPRDNVGRPTAPFTKYPPNTNEQISLEALDLQPLRYNNVQPVLLVSRERSQFNDTIHDQSNVRHNFNGNNINVSPHIKPAGIPVRLEATSKLRTHLPSTYQEQQSHQPVDHQYPFRSLETRRPEGSQLLLKIIPKGLPGDGGFLVPFPRPYPIEKVIEKTVHVPHPIEIEKVIEKKVPFPVERVVEKQMPIPVSHPVPVTRVAEKQIRVPYPINIEQIIDRRVPYAVHRFSVHPYPLHVKQPATYLTHVSPAPIDNPVEKSPAFSQSFRPYRANAEKTTDNDGLVIETKVNKYQQKTRKPVFNGETTNLHLGSLRYEPHQNDTSLSHYYNDLYSRSYDSNVDISQNYVPAAHFSDVRLILPKKFDNHMVLRPSLSKPVFLKQQIVLNLMDKDKATKDEHTNRETPRKLSQSKGFQTKSPQLSTNGAQSSLITAVLRKSRQPENTQYGSFRQSKMEYGFKPPMIPSVQYDESTATKVNN